MAQQINEESFLSLPRNELWEMFKKAQEMSSVALNDVNSKLDLLVNKMEKMETEIKVCKAVNTALKTEIVNLKRQINKNAQYNRQENLEFSGIPESVPDHKLEKITIALMRKTGVEVAPDEIVDCHRLRNKKIVIARFVNRKYAQAALLKSKNLRGNTGDIIPNSIIFMNRNLTPEFRSLRWKAKRMKEANCIHAFGISKKGLWVKHEADGVKKEVAVDEDLFEYLPTGKNLSEICS